MDSCFRSSTRFRALPGNWRLPAGIEDETELFYNDGEQRDSTLLHLGGDWNKVMNILANKLVWIVDGSFFTVNDSYGDLDACPSYGDPIIDGGSFFFLPRVELLIVTTTESSGSSTSRTTTSNKIHIWTQFGIEQPLSTTIDLLLELLRNSVDIRRLNLTITGCNEHGFRLPLPVSTAALERFLSSSENDDNMIEEEVVLTLRLLFVNEECFRLLGNADCKNLGLELIQCEWDDDSQGFAAGSRCCCDRGPKKIVIVSAYHHWNMRASNIVLSLRGNTRLASLKLKYVLRHSSGGNVLKEEEMQMLAPALLSMQGLEEFHLNSREITDQAWALLWKTLQSLPMLKRVNLEGTFGVHDEINVEALVVDGKRRRQRTLAIAASLRDNITLKSINIGYSQQDQDIWRKHIQPRLDLNVFQPRFDVFSQMEVPLRMKLLGTALATIQSKPHLLYLFLKGNSDIIGECMALAVPDSAL